MVPQGPQLIGGNVKVSFHYVGKGKTPPGKEERVKGPPPIRVLPKDKTPVPLAKLLATEWGGGKQGSSSQNDGKEERAKEGLIFISEGLPPLPAKIVWAVEKGDYVDFVELLPKKPSMEDQPITELAENVILVTQVKQMAKKRPIKDIETWMEAFCTFAAIRSKNPECMADLLAYGASIARGARDYGGSSWLSYDFQFRRLAAAKKLTRGWGQKDVALWNDTFLKPDRGSSTSNPNTDPLDSRQNQ